MHAEIVDDTETTESTFERRDFVALLLAAFAGVFALPTGGRNVLAATAGDPSEPGHWEARGFLYLSDRLRCRSGHAEIEIAAHPDGTGALTFWRNFTDERLPNMRHSLFPEPTGRVTIQVPHGAIEALLGTLFAPKFLPLRLLPIAPHRAPEWEIVPTGDPELTPAAIAAAAERGIELSTDAGYNPELFAGRVPYNAIVYTYGRTFLAELEAA
jgi:hypothetical protein